MHSLLSFTLLASALIPEASTHGTVELNLKRSEPVKRNLFRRQDESSGQLPEQSLANNEFHLQYFIEVTIGTPAQTFPLHIDTGSSDVWVVEKGASVLPSQGDIPGTPGGQFDPELSSTFNAPDELNGAFNISYVDKSGSTGSYIKDNLVIGDATLEGYTIGLANKTTLTRGLLGLGLSVNEASNVLPVEGFDRFTYPNVVETMVNQSYIPTAAFSLWLNDIHAESGSILFGGVDTGKYTGDLTSIGMWPGTHNVTNEYLISWTGLSISTDTGTMVAFEVSDDSNTDRAPERAVLDSGATNAVIPDSVADSLYQITGATWIPEFNTAVVPCSFRDVAGNFTFTFAETASVTVPMSNMIYPATINGTAVPIPYSTEDACVFGFAPKTAFGVDGSILGDVFLRSAYVVYDMENKRIGIAQSNFNSTESNIVPFESLGAPIPSATQIDDAETPAFTTDPKITAAYTQATGNTFGGDAGKAFQSAYAAFTSVNPSAAWVSSSPTAKPSSTSAGPSGTPSATGKKDDDKDGAGNVLHAFEWERVVLIAITFVLMVAGGFLV